MTKHFARRQVRDTVRNRNGPDTLDIKTTPIDLHALVYRPEKDRWEVPYSILDMDDEYCTLLLPPPSGPSKFRTTVFKRYFPERQNLTDETNQGRNNLANPDYPSINAACTKEPDTTDSKRINFDRFRNS